MTRKLILLRHAKSSWDDPRLADHARPLAARGKRDARHVGEYLATSGLEVDEVLCSSAERTRETWQRVRARFPGAPEARVLPDLYLPTLSGFVSAIASARPETRTLLVVGHSPVLDAFVLSHAWGLSKALRVRLVDGLPTGSVTVLELPIASFSALTRKRRWRAKVSAFTSPRDLVPSARRPHEQPLKGERVEITRKTSVRELASQAFASAVHQVRANAHGAHRAESAEFGHHQRVGVRRLRLYVRLFRKLLGARRARHLTRELRWLFQALGALREHDVFAETPQGQALLHTRRPALAALGSELRSERKRSHEVLQHALDSTRYLHLVRDLVALEAELTQRGRGDDERARDFLKHELARRWKRVRARARRLAPDDVVGRHALRKALKKLRYAAELGRGAFGRHRSARFLDGLSSLQDELGALSDEQAHHALLEHALTRLAPQARAAARKQLPELVRAGEPKQVPHEALAQLRPFWR